MSQKLTLAPKIGATQEEILQDILTQVEPVDFKELIERVNKRNLNPRERDIVVLVIEWLYKHARLNGTAFGRTEGCNYLYLGTHWQAMQDEQRLCSFLSRFALKMGVDFTDARYWGFRQSLLEQFSAVAPSFRADVKHPSINLQNGTFEFGQGGGLRKHSASDGFTYLLPFGYDPDAVCPVFDGYLKKVLPDEACRNVIAEYIGSIFVPPSELKLEKVLLLYGGGSNGKSVLFEVVNTLLGVSNITSFSLRQLTDGTGYYRARFSDKLLNYSSEISRDLDTTLFKQLASGEPVDARSPYGKPFIMRNYGKMMFNCNELPADVEHTNGFFRRFLIVPFNVTISEQEQDKTLTQRIVDNELAGVFNWVLRGMERLLKQGGFTESALVAEQLRLYSIESDSVKLFLQEQCYVSCDRTYVLLGSLYQEYKSFCEQGGYKSVNQKNFRKRLTDGGTVMTRHSAGGYKVYLKHDLPVQEMPIVGPDIKLF